MADLVPIVTDNTSNVVTWDAAGIINAINAHTFGADWTIDDHNVGQGIAVRNSKAGEGHTTNLRKLASGDANHVAVSLSPSELIDDAGNDTPTLPTQTGATPMGADWSGEVQWDLSVLGGGSAGSKMWIVEYPDALFILISDPTNAFFITVMHAGRIWQPTNGSNVSTVGQDGLGVLAGKPAPGAATTAVDLLFGTGIDADDGLLHYETNNWNPRTYSSGLTVTNFHSADGGDGETNVFFPGLIAQADIGGQTPMLGVYKYIRASGITDLPKVVQPVPTSNQGWMHIKETAAVSYTIILWDKTVTP